MLPPCVLPNPLPLERGQELRLRLGALHGVAGPTEQLKIIQVVGNTIPEHPDGSSSPQFKELSNGLFVESKWDVHGVALRCVELLTKFGQNPKQFQMGQYY